MTWQGIQNDKEWQILLVCCSRALFFMKNLNEAALFYVWYFCEMLFFLLKCLVIKQSVLKWCKPVCELRTISAPELDEENCPETDENGKSNSAIVIHQDPRENVYMFTLKQYNTWIFPCYKRLLVSRIHNCHSLGTSRWRSGWCKYPDKNKR